MRELLTGFRWGLTGEPQSMLVQDGRVVWREARLADLPAADRSLDLGGRFLLPGFVDAHCHVLPSGLNSKALDLSAAATRNEVLDALRDRHTALAPGQWLKAVRYDQNRFDDGKHVDRAELDRITAERPILIRHVSGHAAVVNSAAFEAAGAAASQAGDPNYVRDASGRLTGLLLEDAADRADAAMPVPTLEEMVEAILAAGDEAAAAGVTCAADMMTGYSDLERELTAYRLAAERGCRIRLRLYVQWSRVLGPRGIGAAELRAHANATDGERCRIAGLKVFADGALSARTAAIHGAYEGAAPTHDGTWSGNLIYNPRRLAEMICKADDAGLQTATHALGDYATDRVLDALEVLPHPERHRIEHVMILSDAQISRIARLGVPCSLQPEFLMRLRPAYLRSIGPERTSKLERTRSLLDAGVSLGLSSDKPVVPGEPWDGILTASRRPDGFDQVENVTRTEAILGYTSGAADICGDGARIGRLEPGEWADYQAYDEDPLSSARPQAAEVRLGG